MKSLIQKPNLIFN